MTKAHELMGVCMDELAAPQLPESDARPSLIMVPQRPKLVIVSTMTEAVRGVIRPVPFFNPAVKTIVYADHPEPSKGLRLAPKAWTHADTLHLERENRKNNHKLKMAQIKAWAQRKHATR